MFLRFTCARIECSLTLDPLRSLQSHSIKNEEVTGSNEHNSWAFNLTRSIMKIDVKKQLPHLAKKSVMPHSRGRQADDTAQAGIRTTSYGWLAIGSYRLHLASKLEHAMVAQ